ncbi:putative DDE superfamily endonuclease [Paratrimastix pyriformis]|uniref:DDE superfamily endonuclease n=1 Tax=Paratrimastix pyriformis TaxID=342808 RepID=A0ABQ8U6G4_9EUKA|nr:putative DDE superfamily endonuclease [Paratrimastix pyriformis]
MHCGFSKEKIFCKQARESPAFKYARIAFTKVLVPLSVSAGIFPFVGSFTGEEVSTHGPRCPSIFTCGRFYSFREKGVIWDGIFLLRWRNVRGSAGDKRGSFGIGFRKIIGAVPISRSHSQLALAQEHRFETVFPDPIFFGCTCALDGTECHIRRPVRDQAVWYSGKKGCHTIKYEGACTAKGELIFARGGIPGCIHDSVLTRLGGGLATMLEPGESAVADLGYIGIDWCVTPIKRRPREDLDHYDRLYNQRHGFGRAVIEHLFRRSVGAEKPAEAAFGSCDLQRNNPTGAPRWGAPAIRVKPAAPNGRSKITEIERHLRFVLLFLNLEEI